MFASRELIFSPLAVPSPICVMSMRISSSSAIVVVDNTFDGDARLLLGFVGRVAEGSGRN